MRTGEFSRKRPEGADRIGKSMAAFTREDNSDPRSRLATLLKLAPGEQEELRELEFELDFLARLTTAQRFELMFEKSRQMAELLRAHGYGEAAPLLKRS